MLGAVGCASAALLLPCPRGRPASVAAGFPLLNHGKAAAASLERILGGWDAGGKAVGCCLAWEASPPPQMSPKPETSPIQSRDELPVMRVSVCSGFSCRAVLWFVPHRAQKGFGEEMQRREAQVKPRHQADTRAQPHRADLGLFPIQNLSLDGEDQDGCDVCQAVFLQRQAACPCTFNLAVQGYVRWGHYFVFQPIPFPEKVQEGRTNGPERGRAAAATRST